MHFRCLIPIILSIVVSSEVLSKDTIEMLQYVEVTGGRPLHQAIDLDKELQAMQRKYSYIRCVRFQLTNDDFGDANIDKETLFPKNMSETLDLTKTHLAKLKSQRDSLFWHHEVTENNNIPLKEQASVSRLKKEVTAFRSVLDTLFNKVSKVAAEIEKASICNRLLAQ